MASHKSLEIPCRRNYFSTSKLYFQILNKTSSSLSWFCDVDRALRFVLKPPSPEFTITAMQTDCTLDHFERFHPDAQLRELETGYRVEFVNLLRRLTRQGLCKLYISAPLGLSTILCCQNIEGRFFKSLTLT